MRIRVAATLVAVVLLGIGVGCADDQQPTDDLTRLVEGVPADLAGRGLLLRRGSQGTQLLGDQLGLRAEAVRASLATGAPTLRLLLVEDHDDVVPALLEDGFTVVDADADRVVLVRPTDRAGYVGVPAVAVAGDLVAVGSQEQLAALLAGGASLPVATAALEQAEIALAQPAQGLGPAPAAGAGTIPRFTSAVLTAEAGGTMGRLALLLPSAGSQEDAVGLDVRVRTAGPVEGSGRPLLEPVAALTEGSVVSLELRWAVSAAAALTAGSGTGLLDFLAAG